MARSTFGGTASDFVFTATSGRLLRLTAANLTMWTAESGGAQIVDLLLNGSPATVIPVSDDGQVPAFQGPDGVTELWADAGGGRIRIVAEGKQGPAGPVGPGSDITGAEIEAARDVTLAARDEVLAVPTTTDGLIAGQINTPGSLTETALSETNAAQMSDDASPVAVATTARINAALADLPASGGGGVTLEPLYVPNLSNGSLLYSVPANLRTDLPATEATGGGFAVELEIAVTGTEGSTTLTTTETTKVAGLGTDPFGAALHATDGTADFFASVIGHNGSTTITLREPLPHDFTGTLASRYDSALGQHLTAGATRAYARTAAACSGVLGSRGAILSGTFTELPPTRNGLWVRNAALLAYGASTVNGVASNLFADSSGGNINLAVDKRPIRCTPLAAGVTVGTHEIGHGGTATIYAGRKNVVLEFWTATQRSTASMATSFLNVTVTVDGVTAYSAVHDGYAQRVALPLHEAGVIQIDVTNADGGEYYILLQQATVREAGSGSRAGVGRKIVTLGDSYFMFYDGLFATTLAEVTGSTVINHGVGGMTTEWALAWFNDYVLPERPDECWLHFFTNDSNDLSADTFIAPDGSSQPKWPAGLTAAQAKAHWAANIAELIRLCQAAGIKPVVMLPGGTASPGQANKHAEWSWWLDRTPLADGARVSTNELAAATDYVNVVGKFPGRRVFNSTTSKPLVATSGTATGTWVDATGTVAHTPA